MPEQATPNASLTQDSAPKAHGSPPSRNARVMNQSQKEKKRQNDRDAQRKIRERTKAQIETLENRVKELESGQAWQDFEKVLARAKQAEAQVQDFNQRFAAVYGVVQPIVNHQHSSPTSTHEFLTLPPLISQDLQPHPADSRQWPSRMVSHSLETTLPVMLPITSSSNDFAATAQLSPYDRPEVQTDGRNVSYFATSPHSHQQYERPYLGGSVHRIERPDVPFTTPYEESSQLQYPARADPHRPDVGVDTSSYCGPSSSNSRPKHFHNILNDAREGRPSTADTIMNDASRSPSSTYGSEEHANGHTRPSESPPLTKSRLTRRQNGSTTSATSVPSTSSVPLPAQEIPKHLTLPKNTNPTTSWDRILTDFIVDSRDRIGRGESADSLMGTGPNMIGLFKVPENNQNLLSNVSPTYFSEICAATLNGFRPLRTWPEKIAVMYNMYVITRWLIVMNEENYMKMPWFLRPTPLQARREHPLWIDYVIWPDLREEMVREWDNFPLSEFFEPYSRTLNTNWSGRHDALDLLKRPSQHGKYTGSSLGQAEVAECQDLRMIPEYESHLQKLENYSLGEDFSKTLPMLQSAKFIRFTPYKEW